MKIECYECKKEFDKDDDIICRVVESSLTAIFYGFMCRECKDKEMKAKLEKEQKQEMEKKKLDEYRKNKKWWQ